MSSFDEYRKKLQEKYGTTKTEQTKVGGAKGTSATGSSTSSSASNKSSSTTSGSSFDAYREKLKSKYSPGSKGWQKYLDDNKADEEAVKAAEKDKSFWEKVGDFIVEAVSMAGQSSDSTLPMANASNTINYLREDTSYMRPQDDWSKEQQYEFGALYLESPAKAYAYAEEANKKNAQAKEEAERQKIQDNATSGFWAGAGNTIGAIAAAPLGLADYLNDLMLINAGREITPDGVISPYEYSQAVTEGISTNLNEKGGVLNENIPIIGGKGWGDVYGLGTSIAQSLASAYTLGPTGTLISYFGQGAASGVDDALSRGASEEQAVLYGTALGVFEGLAEKIGVDNLFKLGSTSGIIKNILKQAGAEGAEEGLTSLFSNIADNVIMQDKSNFYALVELYMSNGMSESEAKFKAWMDSVGGIAFDTIAGSITGGVSGGIHTGVQKIASNIDAKKIYGNGADLVSEALDIDADNAYAQKMQAKLDNGKNLSGGQINRLVEINEQALRTQDTAKMKSAVESRLTELGETGDISKLADVIVKAQSGEKLTSSERNTLVNSKYGRRVSTELNPQSIESGEYTSQWAENIGTERINAEAYNKALYDLASEKAGVTMGEEKASATVNATSKEIATESKFEASEDGKTRIGDTEVSIKEIASVKNGEVTLRLEDGSTVKASDVTFGSNEALLYENVVHMGLNAATANAFINNYDGNIPVAEYALDFRQAYRYGELGIPKAEIYSEELSSKLSDSQKSLAYDLGKIDAKYNVSEKNELNKAKIASTDTINADKNASKGKKKGKLHNTLKPTNETQRASLKALGVIAEALGIDIYTFESDVVDGKREGSNGWYDRVYNRLYIDLYAGADGKGTMLYTTAHELTHHIREKLPAKFKAFADFLFEEYGKEGISVAELIAEKRAFLEEKGRITPDMTEQEAYDLAYEEVVADSCESFLADGEAVAKIAELKAKDKTLWQTIKDFITNLVARIKAAYAELSPNSVEGRLVSEMLDSAEKLQQMWTEMLVEASDVVEIDTESKSVAPIMNSERTWTASEYVTERKATAEKIAKALGVDIKTAYKYIDDINSVARLIADDRARLDYEPNLDDHATVLKPNSDYKYSVDMSTLCAKRLLFTGTFDAIQRALPNMVFDSEDIVALREMMQKRGYEVACGICYVESTRREIGRITQEFIDSYKEAQKTGKPITRINSEGKAVDLKKTNEQKKTTADKSTDKFFAEKDYTPTLADLNTTDIDLVKRDHPLVYEAYLNFMNARGQAKPKLLETRAEYKGEILKHFKVKSAVTARNNAGGLRLQSFSDFEVPHLIDMMQIVMDMSRVGLKSQAYTKVPAFAEIFGDTGVKINLSLIAKGDGLDANGNLIFDDVEGINHNEAFKLRDKFSKNVGTILVGKNDAHIIAAMADPRIDYIIPFHKSSWKESLYDALGLTGYADYTDFQHEKPIDKSRKISDYDPSEYWDYTKSGDENAQIYLEKCREDGRIPKFPQFQGYPGYWKLLIDFKMYDNDGIGSPQEVVQPIFDMEASERILGEYKGGHKSFPVAKDVVEDFVKERKDRFRYSDRNSIDNKWDKGYNLYTTTDDFIRQVPYRMRHAFARSLANKTSGMTEGEIRTVYIYAGNVYAFRADGYMHGEMVEIIAPSEYKDKIAARKEYKNEIDTDTKTADLWFKPISDIGRGSRGDISVLEGRGRSDSYDTLSEDSSERYTSRYTERERQTFESKEEVDEIVKKLREMYGLGTKKYSDRTSYASTFYSYMGKVIDGIKLDKMGAGGVVSYLKGRGVKDEEIKWSGIEAFLEGKKSVTKAELQEFVAGSQLTIEEEMSGYNKEAYDELEALWLKHAGVSLSETFSDDFDLPLTEDNMADVFDDMEREGYDVPSIEDQRRMLDLAKKAGNEGRWAKYKIAGGKNYRELVFKMPNSSYSNNAMRGHWGQDAEGVLAHARIQDITTSDGKKMLFIEEIQSDWHNEGAEKGYLTSDIREKIEALGVKADEAYFKVEDYSTEVTGLAGEWDTIEKTPKGAKLLREFREADRAYKKAMDAEIHGIEDAPFKNTYHEYVLKRLLRMAAEEGYDSLGWTPADIQADRWSYDYEEAYKIEYDQDIPKFLRKYGKKWGATVGTAKTTEGYDVWSMDLTDAMTESVLYEGQVLYSDRVTDTKTLNFLENQEHITTYKSFVEIDGKLYSPMATKVKGDDGKYRLTNPSEIGVWQQAEEKPDSIPKFNKSGYGYYVLKKDDGSTITAAYNPYEHSSNLVLNDQFEGAYQRPNLVTVECIIPKSEMTSGYKAKYAKDSVGYLDWKSGTVAGKLKDNKRKVYLSRWLKPVRILSDAEVATMYKEILGTNISVPFNVVTPQLLTELEKVGVKIDYEGSPGYQYRQSKKATDVKYSDRNTASFKGKAFWSGSVSLLDGVIEEVHTMEEAEDADFHHSMYFSQAQVEKMANEENAFFFVENGKVQGDWRVSIPEDIIERIKGQISIAPKYSERDSDSVSNRSLLANALESVAQNDIERNKLKEYKSKIALIESEQAKLAEIRSKIKELSFAKGPRDNEAINKLRFAENQTANRINTYDRQLLNLEATTALRGVLEREKQMAYKRAEKKGKEALKAQREKDRERNAKTQRELMTRYQESRKKNVEGRKKTEMRYKIKKITSELDTLLRNPTAKKHIKEELRAEVADALLAINMDTVGAEERLAEIHRKLQSARDPYEIEHLLESYNRISLQGDKLKDRLDALRSAYEKIKATDDIELSMSYQEVIHNSIKAVSEKVGNTSIRNMTLEQLEMVYELFKMIRHTVRDANKSFKEKKGQTIMQMAEAVNDQVRTVGGQPYKRNAVSAAVQRVGWTFLKPYVAFRTIGSITLTNMYKELRAGEDTFYGDVKEAQAFIEAQYKKHGYKSWDMKQTKTFTAKSGKTFALTLEQMMTLYAYSKRDQAHKHIIEGGIVFEDAMVVEKNKAGIPIKYEVTTKDAFNLSEETFAEIANSLTAEQKAFVDEMQRYLSVTMGAKGNEVSMELLGVKLFKEEFYLPIKSSQYYRNFSAEEAGEVKLKSPAFSKETVQHANNPIVLHNFTDLWAEHINDMSMYHSFVLALEDFTRVYNYKTKTDAKVETMDTKATIETAYPGATKYISKFLKDMNGGVRGETVGWAEKLTSLAKKGAVLGSASVAIQQHSAVMRAMAYINPKYFVTTAHKSVNLIKHKQDFEELKKYAPIAGIKEMGRFDVGMGQGTVDWIQSNKTLMEKGEDILSAAPAFMDEVTWVSIWNAVKRETVHTHKNLRPGSEEFLKVAGERFTEVISLSQVYDSVFSRSDLMRNKSLVAKWLTAFMAEPTTTLNMLWDSWVQAKRTGGFKAYAKATVTTGGAVVASIVLNAALKALVTAGRDDDEDESYAEKYLEHFFGDLKDSLNPLTLIPVVKDIVSIFKGYDVERMDMALFSDLKNAIDAFDSDSKNAYEKWSGLVGAISAFFGVPVKNVERDIRAAINTIFGETEDTTKAGLIESIKEGWTGKETANSQQLYEAMVSGDTAQIERVKGRFKDQNAINSAIRKALRENDPRIKEAAVARANGDIAEYMRIAKEIIAEGHFKQDDIVAAINSEINALKKGESTTEASTSNKVASIYKMDDYYAALVGRDQATAYVVKEDLIKTDVANGKDRDEAEEDFNSKFTSYIREQYEDGEISDSNALNMLVNYGEKSEEDASSKVQYWAFKKEYPDYDLSEEAVKKYYNEVEPYGINIDVYYTYSKQRSKAKGTDANGDGKTDSGSVKREVLSIINSLPISSSQKDVLYYLNGWSASTIREAPWR